MFLSRPSRAPGRAKTIRSGPRTPTTEPGFTNPNRQVVQRATGAPSSTRPGQSIYALGCRDCGFVYGCNGLDVKERRCPGCQGGVTGEALREEQPSLFQA